MLKTQQVSQHADFGLALAGPKVAPSSRSSRRRSVANAIRLSRQQSRLYDEQAAFEAARQRSKATIMEEEPIESGPDRQLPPSPLKAKQVEGGAVQRRPRPLGPLPDVGGEELENKLNRGQHCSAAIGSAPNPSEPLPDSERQPETVEASPETRQAEFKAELVWTNILLFVVLHSCLPIGLYLLYTQRPWRTLLFSIAGMYASGLGVTGGTHRLWSHRAYKASWPVQMLLMLLQTMAGQNSIYTWSRDHRVHHKFSETDADPHNIKRGFFFAHMGWLCCKKHPDVKVKGQLIDMSDLEANPIVMFQHRHFWWLSALFTVVLPTAVPVLCWNERIYTSFVFSFMIRYLITLHGTWLVNSAAHYYGHRPYDKRIEARESPFVIYNGLGEGFHNYHHTFPYDYATSEFGKYFNITTVFIDACAALGLVKDRRRVDRQSVVMRRLRTGLVTLLLL